MADATGTGRPGSPTAGTVQGPNLYLVGPPRSGTTSLNEWLAQHPDIGTAELKEPLYHAGDLRTPQRIRDRSEYLALYDQLHHTYLVDASPWYLYSTQAAESIRSMSPHAHIVINLRDPVEVLASLHTRHVLVGLEPEPDFARAVLGPRTHVDRSEFRRSLDYLAVARVGEQAKRYTERFPGRQLHYVPMTELSESPRATHLRLLADLGLDRVPLERYVRFNAARSVRSRLLSRTIAGIAGVRGSSRVRRAVASRLSRRVASPGRQSVPPAVAAAITDELRDDIALLAELSGHDLSPWLGR